MRRFVKNQESEQDKEEQLNLGRNI